MNLQMEGREGKGVRALILAGLLVGLTACGGGGGDDEPDGVAPDTGGSGEGTPVDPLPVGGNGVETILEGDWTYCDTSTMFSGRETWSFRGNTYKQEAYTYRNGSCIEDGTEIKVVSLSGRFELGDQVITEEGLPAEAIDFYLRQVDGDQIFEQVPRFSIVYRQEGVGLFFGDLTVVEDAFEQRTNKLDLDAAFERTIDGKLPQ